MANEQFVKFDPKSDLSGYMSAVHAQPGVDYLFTQIDQEIRAAEEGWTRLPGAPYVKIDQKNCVIMYRGGVIPGGDINMAIPMFYMDPELETYCFPPAAPSKPSAVKG